MEKRIFSEDKDQGITRYWHYNDETDEATIQTQQDVTAIIEENKQEFNMVDERAGWKGEFHRVASIQTQQDVTAIIEENKQEFNMVDERAGWKGEFHRVASIPMSIYAKLRAEGKLDDQEYMKRWLNDPENRFFRVRPGQV